MIQTETSDELKTHILFSIHIFLKKFSLSELTFLIRVQAFRDPLRGELPHVHIVTNDGRNPLT